MMCLSVVLDIIAAVADIMFVCSMISQYIRSKKEEDLSSKSSKQR